MAKQPKTPLPLRIIQSTFPMLEKVAPPLARRAFFRIFFTPVRYPYPYSEMDAMEQAVIREMLYKGETIKVYEWGEGQPVLFAHGWMGRATQFKRFIPAITKAGYKMVAFDAPAHGKSTGRHTHLMEFADIIGELDKEYRFATLVGHSLGGVSAMHAIIRGVGARQLVMISSPAIEEDILEEYRHRIGASRKTVRYFQEKVKKLFEQSFKEFTAEYIIAQLKPEVALYLIHDENDTEVSPENSRLLSRLHENTTLQLTTGLGHTKILKDQEVINSVLQLIQGD